MKFDWNELLLCCQEGRPASLEFEAEGHSYTRLLRPPDRLILLGAGHISQALCRLACELGFSVTVADERAEFANRDRFPGVHTPIGLEIGALTVPEIAVSIAAQLIQCRRRDTRRSSGSSVLTAEDIDLPLLKFLAGKTPKALLIVYESSGSIPAKSGAMMAVDRAGGWAGTIGGGAAEHEAMEAARRLIGTGDSRCFAVDMDNDAAAEEGMACGGHMKIWMADIEVDG